MRRKGARTREGRPGQEKTPPQRFPRPPAKWCAMGHDKRNRRRGNPRTATFLTLPHWMLDCLAFQHLSPYAAKVLLRLARRFNGANNGRIGFSVRQATAECRIAFNTARKALAELQAKGFIEVVTPGGFSLKDRHSTEWRLTYLPTKTDVGLVEGDKPFMRWRPEK